MNKHFFLVASSFALFSANAHAYVDPGTGSMAIQFLIGGLVAAGFMLKTYYYKLKNMAASFFGQSTTAQSDIAEGDTDRPSKTTPADDPTDQT
jgi:hypothetical protein